MLKTNPYDRISAKMIINHNYFDDIRDEFSNIIDREII